MSFRPILGIPRLTQDWGTDQHERESHWTSLFYDLLIVAALNAIAEPFEERDEEEEEERRFLSESGNSSGDSSGVFVLTPIQHLWLNALLQFISVVGPWNFLNEFTSRFEDESLIGHLSFFVHCFGLAATTAGCVGDLEQNFKVLAMGILLAKVGLLVLFLRPIVFVPRSRTFALVRSFTFLINILIMLFGLYQYPNDFESFRVVLIIGTIWDWVGITSYSFLTREQNVPLHIQSFADRIKEVTMIIFGEAIFAVILQPNSEAQPETHFYVALALTLWLIYSLALQEFHILPDPDDHALRRSRMFGYLWYYTQGVKQVCLLGASIGIKRVHLLMFKAPLEPIDTDTRNLVVWGLSLTMFAVLMIRSYSFGYGRHPSEFDPPHIYKLKVLWWFILGFSCLWPQVVDWTIFQYYSAEPMVVLISFGLLMGLIILTEAALSNIVAAQYKKLQSPAMEHGESGELTYLRHHSSHVDNYKSTPANEEDNAEERRPIERASFLAPLAPKKEG